MSAGIDARPQTPVPPGPSGPPVLASPEASRVRRRPWRDPRLVVGVALVAVSVLVGARLLAGADDRVAVWAARSAMSTGQPVGPGDLVRTRVRFDSQHDADRYLSADAAPAPGTVLRRDVGAGELLPRAAISGRAAADLVEVPLSVPSDGVPATVRVGSVVDVWVTPDRATVPAGEATPGRATLVFDDVSVVAAPRTATALGPTATRQVIIGVGGDQRSELSRALARLSGGSVVLTRQR